MIDELVSWLRLYLQIGLVLGIVPAMVAYICLGWSHALGVYSDWLLSWPVHLVRCIINATKFFVNNR